MPNASRLEWIGKYAAILSGLVAATVGIANLRRGVSQSIRELEWRQADMARTITNAMMKDDGWQAMTMLDWEEGRTYEVAPGTIVRILPTDVPVAIEASLRKNGRRRTEPQRFITDRYDLFLFQVSQLQGAVRSGLVRQGRCPVPARLVRGEAALSAQDTPACVYRRELRSRVEAILRVSRCLAAVFFRLNVGVYKVLRKAMSAALSSAVSRKPNSCPGTARRVTL